MKTLRAKADRVAYDNIADVLFVGLRDVACSDAIDTPRGITVYYSYPDGALSGISIERFRRRFGKSTAVEIDAAEPFKLLLPKSLKLGA